MQSRISESVHFAISGRARDSAFIGPDSPHQLVCSLTACPLLCAPHTHINTYLSSITIFFQNIISVANARNNWLAARYHIENRARSVCSHTLWEGQSHNFDAITIWLVVPQLLRLDNVRPINYFMPLYSVYSGNILTAIARIESFWVRCYREN